MRRGMLLVALATALVTAAPAVAQEYDETENWLNSYGRTVDHWSAPDRTVRNALVSAERYIRLIGEADRIPSRSMQQAGAWPWNGDMDRGGYDRQGDWTGIKIEFEFGNRTGHSLAATVWAPSDQMLAEAGLDAPLPGLIYSGGFISSQPMYYWFAQEMARNGYVVMTYDVTGQGRSEGSSTGNAANDLRDAIDFFVSTPDAPYANPRGGMNHNPLYRTLDRERIGTAGHSMGAGAVQTVADHCGVVDAISPQSDMGASYATSGNTPAGACGPRNPVPAQGQGADYESFIFPTQPSSAGPSDPGKLAGFDAVSAAGIDTQEIVIESGSHMAWSHVTWAYTASWSEQVAFHYSLAWFDRYLHGDIARDGRTGTDRLTEVFSVDAEGHGLSKKFMSAYDVDDGNDGRLRCRGMVEGCP